MAGDVYPQQKHVTPCTDLSLAMSNWQERNELFPESCALQNGPIIHPV